MTLAQKARALHARLGGKFSITPKTALTPKNLSLLYTPGVSDIVEEISKNKKEVYRYTIKHNSVAVVSDGSRILGLGNRGAEAALPVMEGKAILFKEFANIDAFPLCVRTQDPDEIVSLVRNIAPVFGGINVEDLSTPKCFYIEEALQDLGIPVMHDDQHGTAIVILGALINAARVVKKPFEELKVVINGAGAAGTAAARLLSFAGHEKNLCQSVRDILVCDSKGILHHERKDLEPYKQDLVRITNKQRKSGTLQDALHGADVFIGVSAPKVLSPQYIRLMERNPIVFALANPVPEIMPQEAQKAGAAVVATGRSDFPNQVNNVLAFPGVFRGALDARAPQITNAMKLAAAFAIAQTVKKPSASHILPSPFDKHVVKNVARAVIKNS